jgi:hypothetical protein
MPTPAIDEMSSITNRRVDSFKDPLSENFGQAIEHAGQFFI